MTAGCFITFEGTVGAGKSTQARILADRLTVAGTSVVLTQEPGGSRFAGQLYSFVQDPSVEPHPPLSQLLLSYAARADHLEKTIRPALLAGRWVISDRFSDSTRVYQVEAGGLPLEIFKAFELIVVKLTYPDLTFILDIPAEVGLRRATTRRLAQALSGDDADAYEKREIDYHMRLREGFLAIGKAEPHRCHVLDGTASEELIAAEVMAQVERRLMPPGQR